MRVALAGLLAGVFASLALGRLLSPFLFGVSASNPGTLACVGGLLMLATLGACYVPSRRAIRLDPDRKVRHE
jgi:ABC-type antimicrobial peptide transport system permease subunit